MKLFFFAYLFLSAQLMFAQTTSLTDGLWSNGLNWSSGVPVSFQSATINNDMTLDTDLNVGNGGDYHINTGSITDLTGGTAYNLDIGGSGNVDVNGNVTFEGNLNLTNSGTLIIRSYDTLRIGGDAEFKNSSSLTIEKFGVLIIDGDLSLRNTNTSVINGNIYVGGDLSSRNSSTISGTGNIETDGEIDIRNSSTIFGSTSDCNPGPCEYGSGEGLPITLNSFNAKAISNSKVLISWETESEVNNDYFLIEHQSTNGNFKPIKKIDGAGNSNEVLSYEQTLTLAGIKAQDHYFRLTQVDFNGESETFNPVYVRLSPTKNSINVYPNPNQGNILNLNLKNFQSGNYHIQLINSQGEMVLQRFIQMDEESSQLSTEVLNGKKLSKGVYFLYVLNKGERDYKKVIVQ